MGPGQPITGGDSPAVEAVGSILLYPLDVLASTAVAVSAPFDARTDITWGPVGALAGICLPWVTLIPYGYPPLCMPQPSPVVELGAEDFEDLLVRIRSGDGITAYRQLVAAEFDRQLAEMHLAAAGACPLRLIVTHDGEEVPDWYALAPLESYEPYICTLTSIPHTHMLVSAQPELDGRFRVFTGSR